jgi:hypothetical protein
MDLRELENCFYGSLDRYKMTWWQKCAGEALKLLMAGRQSSLAFIGAGSCEKEHAVLSSLPADLVKSTVFIDPLLNATGSGSKKMLVETYARDPTTHATIDIAICFHPHVFRDLSASYLDGIASIVKPGGYVLVGADDQEGEGGVPEYSSNLHFETVCSGPWCWYVFRRISFEELLRKLRTMANNGTLTHQMQADVAVCYISDPDATACIVDAIFPDNVTVEYTSPSPCLDELES